MYKSITAKGYTCWPPACNPSDMKVPPNNFGANLTQFTNGKEANGNNKSAIKKNQKYKNGNGNHPKNGNAIVTTRRNIEMEGATRMLGELGHLSRRNFIDA